MRVQAIEADGLHAIMRVCRVLYPAHQRTGRAHTRVLVEIIRWRLVISVEHVTCFSRWTLIGRQDARTLLYNIRSSAWTPVV